MILTSQQEEAIKIAKSAYNSKQTITTIAGFAGTGKTTLVKYIIESLGLEMKDVAFVTFTGKASLVLQQKGLPASTIHSEFYNSYPKSDGTFSHRPKPELDNNYKLIIIDEISMVSQDLIKVITKHQIPVIALGDPGQLPPIGMDNGLLSNPDIFLTEVMRQEAENPIIRLSMDIREGKGLRLQKNDNVQVIHRSELVDGMFSWADQILCGYNTTRQSINQQVRHMKGFTNIAQPENGDKIICLKNYWNIYSKQNGTPLINGTTGELSKIRMQTEKDIYIDFKPDFSEDIFKNIQGDLCPFNGNTRLTSKWKNKGQDPVLFDYGYAITTHKAQGSQYNKILLFEEVLNGANHNRWLYTAITRAIEKIVIVKA